MKIGILTFQHSVNFGAQLQCLALQEVIKNLNHEVEIIQFIPDNIDRVFYRNLGIKKNGILLALKFATLKLLFAKKMRKRFFEFKKKYLSLTVPCDIKTIGKITRNYDAIIVGSDQVWGPSFHAQAIFFFGWKPEFIGKRISYAPCCAINKVESVNKPILTKLLKKINSLSVRNLETREFVNDLINENASIVLDPTFLYDFSKFKSSFKIPYKKYILVYILGGEINGGHEVLIREIKKKRGDLPVVVVVLSENRIKSFTWADKTYWTLNPVEWVSLISNADFLYTDSFHGIVFAVKFNISVLAYYVDPKRKSRFTDLAERFFLESYICKSVNDAVERKCIRSGIPDYSKVNNFLQTEIIKSKVFLRKVIQ